jgi:hypothetical protein
MSDLSTILGFSSPNKEDVAKAMGDEGMSIVCLILHKLRKQQQQQQQQQMQGKRHYKSLSSPETVESTKSISRATEFQSRDHVDLKYSPILEHFSPNLFLSSQMWSSKDRRTNLLCQLGTTQRMPTVQSFPRSLNCFATARQHSCARHFVPKNQKR